MVFFTCKIGKEVTGVITDDSTLRTVKNGSHGIISLTTDRGKNLAVNTVGEFHNSDAAVVNGPIGWKERKRRWDRLRSSGEGR